jgi:nucleoside-diphosphate-sugar epimerase
MKSILVVGGTGFLGFHISKSAIKKRYRVFSISLKKPKKKRFLKGVKYIHADVTNFETLKKKFPKKIDYIINAGGYGKHPDFGKDGDKIIKSHFFGLINIIKLIENLKIKKFIQIGSSAEYGGNKSPLKESFNCFPQTPYSIAKWSCTTYLKYLNFKYDFPVTILRLFLVYGPKQDNNRIIPFLIENCKNNNKFSTTKGEQLCDFCYVDDVVEAIFKTLSIKKTNGEIINIGSGKPTQIKKLILLVNKIIGKGHPVIGGLKYKDKTNKKNYPNISKAKNLLSWKPKISFIEGIKRTIKIFDEK